MPPTLAEADPACYDPAARLAHMDANGIYAQGLYPASYAPTPAEAIERDTAIVGEAVMRKVLYDNAARVYHLSS